MAINLKLLILCASTFVCSSIAFSQAISTEKDAVSTGEEPNKIVGEIGGSQQCEARPLRDYATRIMGGDFTSAKYWPGFVALGAEAPDGSAAFYSCGGVLLDERNVLTAAHCLHNFEQDFDTGAWKAKQPGKTDWPMIALANSDDLTADTQSNVARVVGGGGIDWRGRAYRQDRSNRQFNDIAILKLDRDLEGPYATLSASIEADPAIEGHLVWAAGFGTQNSVSDPYIAFDSPRGPGTVFATSQRLRDVILQFKPRHACTRPMGPWISDTMHICAGWDDGAHDTCANDSGGPLVVLDTDGCPVVVGLTSYGYECGSPGAYGVYARVSQYRDWIKEEAPAARFSAAAPPAAGQEAFKRMVDTVLEYGKSSELVLEISYRKNGIAVEPPLIAGNQYDLVVKSPVDGNLMVVYRDETGYYDLLFPQYDADHEAIGPAVEVLLPLVANIDDPSAQSEQGSLTLLVLPRSVDIRSVFLAPSNTGTRKLYPSIAFTTGVELSSELEEINDLLDLNGGDAQVVATELTYEFVR